MAELPKTRSLGGHEYVLKDVYPVHFLLEKAIDGVGFRPYFMKETPDGTALYVEAATCSGCNKSI